MNEFQFIDSLKKIKKNKPIELAIGDDTAIINLNNGTKQLICSDTLVENIHFSFKYFTLYDVIKKTIIVNLSDILAMNGKPLYYLLNLSIPKKLTDKLDQVSKAISDINKEYNIDLIGGDTTSTKNDTFISVTMIGETEIPILRNSAKINDTIFVGGLPGKSSIALEFLLKDKDTPYKEYHIEPKINFDFLKLFKEFPPNSLIDISDGLLNDLSHILEDSSNLGAIINNDNFINYDSIFFKYSKNQNLNPFNFIYNGGEDFIPLFTTSQPEKIKEYAKILNLPLIEVGKIINKEGIFNLKNELLNKKGYLHF